MAVQSRKVLRECVYSNPEPLQTYNSLYISKISVGFCYGRGEGPRPLPPCCPLRPAATPRKGSLRFPGGGLRQCARATSSPPPPAQAGAILRGVSCGAFATLRPPLSGPPSGGAPCCYCGCQRAKIDKITLTKCKKYRKIF